MCEHELNLEKRICSCRRAQGAQHGHSAVWPGKHFLDSYFNISIKELDRGRVVVGDDQERREMACNLDL